MFKNIAIIGFGKSAIASARFLVKNFPTSKIRISELKQEAALDQALVNEFRQQGVEFEFGQQSFEFINFTEEVFFLLSPGIPYILPLVQKIFAICKENPKKQYGTDLDIYIQTIAKEQEYIAVTGTNGKTTTTSLVAHILKTEAIGNIGKPFLEYKDLASKVHALEISSFQLFYTNALKPSQHLPKATIHLNLTPDHLDWHASHDEYRETKEKLFVLSDTQENFWVLNYDDQTTRDFGLQKLEKLSKANNIKSKIVFFSTKNILNNLTQASPLAAYLKKDYLYLAKLVNPQDPSDDSDGIVTQNAAGDYILELPLCKTSALNIVGEHNYSNALAAALASYASRIQLNQIIDALQTFNPVAHRLEFVSEVGGHKVFNDSKATNPDSSAKALLSFPKSIAIVGGKNKYLDLTDFFPLLKQQCHAVIAIGELKTAFVEGLQKLGFKNIGTASNLEEAFQQALDYGQTNDYPIVLTPASSSFDMFRNYEDRGDQFRQLVLDYATTKSTV